MPPVLQEEPFVAETAESDSGPATKRDVCVMRLAIERSWRHGVLVRLWPALVMGQPATDAERYHVRTFCVDDRWPRGELNLPRPLFTEKAYPEDEVVVTSSADSSRAGIEGEFLYERRIGQEGMVEVALPLAYRGSGYATGASGAGRTLGVGDVSFGYKRTVHLYPRRGSIFSLGAEGAEAVLASEPEAGGS